MKKVLGVIVIIAVLHFGPPILSAFERDTHKAINEYIVQNSVNGFSLGQYLTNQLGFQKGVKEEFLFGKAKPVFDWIGDGGKTEDDPDWRSFRHFHDPLKTWDTAGLQNSVVGRSSIIWAQSSDQSYGNYSWFDTRDYFYKALTSASKTDRDKYFAETFRGVGQLMHLVQDISVPAHVRNQAHLGYHYEGFVLKYQNGNVPNVAVTFNSLLANPYPLDTSIFTQAVYDSTAPIPITALWDQNKYTGGDWYPGANDIIGLAEYTNANFFSDFTIFQNYPHPKKENTNEALVVEVVAEDGISDKPYYIQGYQSNRLAAYSYFANMTLYGEPEGWKYTLDDKVYEDYAQKLIPRAVGYSAGLLNYFFRGQIEAVNPVVSNTGATFKVKNNTPNEAMDTPGKFVVSYQYTESGSNPPVYMYGVSNEVALAESIPTGTVSTTEYAFTFPGTGIPSNAQEVKYWLVFRGQLGNEDDAVVGKMLAPSVTLYLIQNNNLISITPNRQNNSVTFAENWAYNGTSLDAVHADQDYVYADDGVHDKNNGNLLVNLWAVSGLNWCLDISSNSQDFFCNGANDGTDWYDPWVTEKYNKTASQSSIQRLFRVTRPSDYLASPLPESPDLPTVADEDNVYVAGYYYDQAGMFRLRLEKRSVIDGALQWTYADPETQGNVLEWNETVYGLAEDDQYVYLSYSSLYGNWKAVKILKATGGVQWAQNLINLNYNVQGIAVDSSGVYVHGEDTGSWRYSVMKLAKDTGGKLWQNDYTGGGAGEDDGMPNAMDVCNGTIYGIGEIYNGSMWEHRLTAWDSTTGALLGETNFGGNAWFRAFALTCNTVR